ncbi:DUF3307 domain-containing protein [Pectobacterium carotovorum]|uniref:DUF3307 domain-containing protein n=1 Tax=Pectobacterium carotovorum TaxID=554 RepID=UPI001E40F2AF|nr:DUF3307 domain-containing protein [Pectobacterium carotovorum]UFT96067.1 DUF3307 domain-containing protein [Pectobacterium carotovorum]
MLESLSLLLYLVLNHIVFDFYLQPDSWVKNKALHKIKSSKLYLHSLLHGIGPFIIFYFVGGMEFTTCLMYSCMIFISHLLIDLIKSYVPSNIFFYIADQLMHVIVLIIIVILLKELSFYKIYNAVIGSLKIEYFVFAFSYSIVLKPVSIIISMILNPWSGSVKNSESHSNGTLDSAGERIGYFERFLVLTFILINQFSAIGFLLAAKSVFRFGDLKNDNDKKMTEYVMLGTLISFTNVIILGVATNYFIEHIVKSQ